MKKITPYVGFMFKPTFKIDGMPNKLKGKFSKLPKYKLPRATKGRINRQDIQGLKI